MIISLKTSKECERINLKNISRYFITGYAKNVLTFRNINNKEITRVTFKGKKEILDALALLDTAIINRAPFIEI